MRAYIEKDPAEADSPCLVIEIGKYEFYLWRRDIWPRFMTYRSK